MICYWRGGGYIAFIQPTRIYGALYWYHYRVQRVKVTSSSFFFCFPGTDQGYHTYTYGWLADQLIRRVDPSHRSAAQFIKEELADPLHVDFFIGLPGSEFYRKAYAYKPGPLEFLYGVKAFFVPLIS